MIQPDICRCTTSTSRVTADYQEFPLEGGMHTGCIIGICSKCMKLSGFPSSNLELMLTEGTESTKKVVQAFYDNYKDVKPPRGPWWPKYSNYRKRHGIFASFTLACPWYIFFPTAGFISYEIIINLLDYLLHR